MKAIAVKIPNVAVATRTHELPALLLREIGRLITIFAAIEHELNLITYTLLRLSNAEGRLAVTRQNVESRMDLLKTLLELNEITLPKDWKLLMSELKDMEEMRDWVAHGVWSMDGKSYFLQITRGSWAPPNLPNKVSRKIIPTSAQVRYETLKGVASVGVELLVSLERFHQTVRAKV